MTQAATVKLHLERRFNDHRIVFWHDPDGEYAADLDSLDLPGVTILRVANDEYAIKYRLLHEQPNRQDPRLPLGTGTRRRRQLAARPGIGLRGLHGRPQFAGFPGSWADRRGR